MAGAGTLVLGGAAQAAAPTVSAVVSWNQALTGAIAATATQATIAARAISMVNEAIYNAWAAYDWRAAFTLWGIGKRPTWEWSSTWKSVAIAYAAHDVLVDLFPTEKGKLDAQLNAQCPPTLMRQYAGYWAGLTGRNAAARLLARRHADGANQLGDQTASGVPYADYTGYQPVNTPDALTYPDRWQPLRLLNAAGQTVVQQFLTPHWTRVRPFVLPYGGALRPAAMDHTTPTWAEMQELIDFSANLTIQDKALVEAWAANPGTVSPPGQWIQIAEAVSANDRNTLDADVKLYFATAQALLDASIVAWDAKRFFDSVRPISAIRYYYRDKVIRSWGGPDQGTRTILGQDWRPFQRATNPTPPFAEFPSGHSTFSAAASTVIAGLRGDAMAVSWTIAQGGIKFETNTPASPVKLAWNSLSEAAAAAGLSRRVGGIHFEQGDFAGRALGRQVGELVVSRCRGLFAGY